MDNNQNRGPTELVRSFLIYSALTTLGITTGYILGYVDGWKDGYESGWIDRCFVNKVEIIERNKR